MKKLLCLTNVLLFFSTFLACPGIKNAEKVGEDKVVISSTDTMFTDTIFTSMDSITGTSVDHVTDSLTKEEKYTQGKGTPKEAPKHQSPDEMKLDSIKKSKDKLKKKD